MTSSGKHIVVRALLLQLCKIQFQQSLGNGVNGVGAVRHAARASRAQ